MSIVLPSSLLVGLSKFIFGGSPVHSPYPYLFNMAVTLSRGHSLSLVSMFLGSLYLRLDVAITDIRRSVGCFNVGTHVSTLFLQLFIYERFKGYAGPGGPLGVTDY